MKEIIKAGPDNTQQFFWVIPSKKALKEYIGELLADMDDDGDGTWSVENVHCKWIDKADTDHVLSLGDRIPKGINIRDIKKLIIEDESGVTCYGPVAIVQDCFGDWDARFWL